VALGTPALDTGAAAMPTWYSCTTRRRRRNVAEGFAWNAKEVMYKRLRPDRTEAIAKIGGGKDILEALKKITRQGAFVCGGQKRDTRSGTALLGSGRHRPGKDQGPWYKEPAPAWVRR